MKKLLITGFSGFVSHHFIEYLENNRIISIVKGLDTNYPNYEYGNLKYVKSEFMKINLLDRVKVENVIAEFQPEYILHLASYSSVAFSWKAPLISFQNNTNIYLNLLEAVRKVNLPTRILSVGSSEEYGKIEKKDLPVTEDHSLKPGSPYAVARVAQELLSKIYTNGYGLDIVMTRSFNHIGSFQKDIFVIPSFVKQLVEIKKKGGHGELIAGDLGIVRDFTDVRDVVSAYYLLITQGKKGEIYNVCSGKGLSLKQVIDKLCYTLNIDINIQLDPSLLRPNENRIIIGSNEKLKNNYDWELKYTIEKSLDDMIRFWQSQN